jgi:hypothetical protein
MIEKPALTPLYSGLVKKMKLKKTWVREKHCLLAQNASFMAKNALLFAAALIVVP